MTFMHSGHMHPSTKPSLNLFEEMSHSRSLSPLSSADSRLTLPAVTARSSEPPKPPLTPIFPCPGFITLHPPIQMFPQPSIIHHSPLMPRINTGRAQSSHVWLWGGRARTRNTDETNQKGNIGIILLLFQELFFKGRSYRQNVYG